MVGSALLCMVFFHSGRLLSRSEGAFFLACFALYLSYLFLAAKGAVLPPAAGWIVLGALVLSLGAVLWWNREG